MFQFFKKKSEEERLRSHYQKLIREASVLAQKDSRAAKNKTAEADKVLTALSLLQSSKDDSANA